ncbi:hypothetical protein SERLADRAFT_434206 [Serpula lacrymans var. lacrymans S7.9]|uniref:Retrotransposon gag domain-containing protein n=1 Tax=Serpula lacrymans var. lacrymans (strain S7.9) TaxID=578457 RepID=F8NJZ3_SERL9|nr:uncharacterized protein SERLADRAFT_434206 [Serpula lacrymans var. lacrymans S7.9]EGO28305.1 hypothetical protein SERLADRAFT_434206 [Serpula lacrymans var. lacrymans S7.9]
MSSQSQPDVNTLLHNMRAQILALTMQLAEMQAHTPAATPSVEKTFNKKVEVVTDSGAFKGDRVRFAEWWIKLYIWVKANWDVFAVGQYAQVRLQKCYTVGVWPTWDDLKVEIEKYFKLQAECNWARQQIRTIKQGNMRTDDFITRFLALSIQGGLGNEHTGELLKCNVNPHIAESLSRVPTIRVATRAGCGQEGTWPEIVRQLEVEKPDDWLNSLAGRSYDEIRAFFYDQQVNEMKAQGKEFGA